MLIKKMFGFLLCVLMLSSTPVFSYMFANGSGGAWPSPPPESSSTSCVSIDKLITAGGSAFLLSLSEFQYYLYQFEQDNTSQSFWVINEAYTQMNLAYSNFFQAYQDTIYKPCNPEMINALQSFDYEGYKETNSCVPSIFDKAREYLQKGRISEWYRDIAERMLEIHNNLNNIKLIVMQGGTPDLAKLWELNQKYLKLSIEGQYIAEVFNRL